VRNYSIGRQNYTIGAPDVELVGRPRGIVRLARAFELLYKGDPENEIDDRRQEDQEK
jgi:hypothetical protein